MALLWALLIVSGDPITAVVALLIGASAVLFLRGPRQLPLGGSALALGLGTLIALPQIVEFLRIVSLSFRGYWGYSASGATTASWNPATALEWLLPLAFGPPDISYWGRFLHQGAPPLIYSLAPGVLALVLVWAAVGREPGSVGGRGRWWRAASSSPWGATTPWSPFSCA